MIHFNFTGLTVQEWVTQHLKWLNVTNFFLYILVIARMISKLNFKHICAHVHVIRIGYCLVLATILQTHLIFWCEHHFSLCMSLIWSPCIVFSPADLTFFTERLLYLDLTRDEFHFFCLFSIKPHRVISSFSNCRLIYEIGYHCRISSLMQF